jgi:hypothetical protein
MVALIKGKCAKPVVRHPFETRQSRGQGIYIEQDLENVIGQFVAEWRKPHMDGAAKEQARCGDLVHDDGPTEELAQMAIGVRKSGVNWERAARAAHVRNLSRSL